MDELKKKLAEFAGITFKHVTIHDTQIGAEFEGYDWEKDMWVFPDGVMSTELNFTQSLDACNPLIQKLDICDLTIEEGIFVVAKVGKLGLGTASAIEEIKNGNPVKAFALALCLAIEKLIDGGE